MQLNFAQAVLEFLIIKSKTVKTLKLFFFAFVIVSCTSFSKQTNIDPWNANQLLAPAELAKTMNDNLLPQPIIICVGPGALIKNSINIGSTHDEQNLQKLKEKLALFPKNANIVIYCGCCPFEHCPNIRPAFKLLNDMHFTDQKLLNLEHNLKVDWIDKGYPSTTNTN